MMSGATHEEKKAGENVIREVKSVSHDVFNLMTVMYGFQEALQAIPVEDESLTRAISEFNQIVNKLQQIGDRLLKLYRDEGGPPAAK
jgi:signal transduction histidine kinase